MASLKKRAKEFETPYPVTKAITKESMKLFL